MSGKSILTILIIVVILIVGYILLSGGTSVPEDSGDNTEDPGMVDEGTVKEFAVEGSNFEFSMKEIKVNEGDTVKITFKSVEGTHDWVIDEFDAKTSQLEADQEEVIEFVADQAGTFEYYCSVGDHRELGMVGNLIVEPVATE